MLKSSPSILNDWSSPYLRKCSFACLALSRGPNREPSATELDHILQLLSAKLDFRGRFLPGKQIVTKWPTEPRTDDFRTVEEFDDAYDEFEPKRFAAKPWLFDALKSSVEHKLLDVMTWSINNKRYKLKDDAGHQKYVAFSHQDDEKQTIAEQEMHHQSLVNEFAREAMRFFANESSIACYRSNHQLDTDVDSAIAECYEGCFFDQTFAFVANSRVLMIWIGHLRWYG